MKTPATLLALTLALSGCVSPNRSEKQTLREPKSYEISSAAERLKHPGVARYTDSWTPRPQSPREQSSGRLKTAEGIRFLCLYKWPDPKHQQSCIKRMNDGWQEVGNVIERYPLDSEEYWLMGTCWSQWFPQMDEVASCTDDHLSAFHAYGWRNPVPANAIGR